MYFVTCKLLLLNISLLLAGYLPGTSQWDALLIYKQEQRYEAWVEETIKDFDKMMERVGEGNLAKDKEWFIKTVADFQGAYMKYL